MPSTVYEKITTLRDITVKFQNNRDEERILTMEVGDRKGKKEWGRETCTEIKNVNGFSKLEDNKMMLQNSEVNYFQLRFLPPSNYHSSMWV